MTPCVSIPMAETQFCQAAVDGPLMEPEKKVSVLIPCRNEARSIERCIRNVFSFVPPSGGFEVIVIDGMSTDGTREILSRLQNQVPELVVIDNPRKIVPSAMNLGIQRAIGHYIVRADARCIHPSTYLLDLIELSERTRGDNVGGVLVPQFGTGSVQNAIALAYKSRIAMGGALRDRGNFIGETDTVYGGCFKRKRLLEVGMYDESMVRNQDDELSFRLREAGGKIVQDGRVKVQYYPRDSFWHLFKQFMQYGYWKVSVIKKHPRQASPRHFLPAVLVLSFIASGILIVLGFHAFWIYVASYFLAVGLFSFQSSRSRSLWVLPGLIFAVFLIHVGFGVGFIIGSISRPFRFKWKWFETLSR